MSAMRKWALITTLLAAAFMSVEAVASCWKCENNECKPLTAQDPGPGKRACAIVQGTCTLSGIDCWIKPLPIVMVLSSTDQANRAIFATSTHRSLGMAQVSFAIEDVQAALRQAVSGRELGFELDADHRFTVIREGFSDLILSGERGYRMLVEPTSDNLQVSVCETRSGWPTRPIAGRIVEPGSVLLIRISDPEPAIIAVLPGMTRNQEDDR